MGKEETATFIGHKECYGVRAEDVRREIEKLIASGVTDLLAANFKSVQEFIIRYQ